MQKLVEGITLYIRYILGSVGTPQFIYLITRWATLGTSF